jgi:hypothetical protein
VKFILSDEPRRASQRNYLVEARAIARLTHPNVVSAFFRAAGLPYHTFITPPRAAFALVNEPGALPQIGRGLKIRVSLVRFRVRALQIRDFRALRGGS